MEKDSTLKVPLKEQENLKELFRILEEHGMEQEKAQVLQMADYIDSTVHNVYDDMIRYHKVIPNKVDIIRKMDMKTLEKIVSSIDFHNMSVVTMMPQEEVL